MKNKRVLFLFLFIFLISISLVLAQENLTSTDAASKVANAYKCVADQVSGKCSTFPTEDKIFFLLADATLCKNEVILDSQNGNKEIWQTSTPIKTTAQAIIALSKASEDTSKAEAWLISQNISPSDIVWYMQIDSLEKTSCIITYDGAPHPVTLNEDKTLSKSAGNCLSLAADDFLLKVASSCLDKTFEISCDKSFQTNMLFKKQTSNVWFISQTINSASSGGKTSETIRSSCFKGSSGKCDYEGSLWAALALDYKKHDVKAYLPYLISFAEENQRFFPDSFLYALTGQEDYKNSLMADQKENQYWSQIDKYYDTAVVLLPISDEPLEKTNTKNWLLEIQTGDGCFPTTLKNTAFLLASIWPKQTATGMPDCAASNYYCVSQANCEGNVLSNYECPGMYTCCDTPQPLQACDVQGGEICTAGQTCAGGTIVEASDTTTCCVVGSCQTPPPQSQCESAGGVCTSSCQSGEVESVESCTNYYDVCCMPGGSPGIPWYVWVLGILIILALVAILLRKKIQIFIQKKGPTFITPAPAPRPGPRPGMPPMVTEQRIQRRIIQPPQPRPQLSPQAKQSRELTDVLKRLKEMGK